MVTKKKVMRKRVGKKKTMLRKTFSTREGVNTKKKAASRKKPDTKVRKSKPKPKKKIGLTLNWQRAIYINTDINDELLKELTPAILKMKQESSQPITIGIDSPGGNLATMQSLLGLLKSPDQDGKYTQIYTVSTNRAYSAAASLLAFGDYAVAFPHSRILYHDVRYAGIEDVTPSKALQAARELERGNVAFSLKLANHIRQRLIWVYIDLKPQFGELRKRYESFAKKYDKAFAEVLPPEKDQRVDVVAFSLALFHKLLSPADRKIALHALDLLNSWMEIERIEKRLSAKQKKGKKSVDIVQGISDLVSEIRSMGTEGKRSSKKPEPETIEGLDERTRKDIKLLLEVLARRFATDEKLSISNDGLDLISEDFSFIKDINSRQHIRAITRMIIDHDHIFFGRSIAEELKAAKDSAERQKILAPVEPQARILWHYIVLICRCLCRGDHFLRPSDAQLLGLVDEVLGGGPVESRREWRKANPDYE